MSIVDTLFNNLAIAIPVLLGVLVLYFELRARRKLQREELEFRKMHFAEDREEREERRKFLRRESLRLTRVAEPLAEYITKELKKDITWAVETLERAKLGLYGQSIFRERYGHFRQEKQFLAKHFVPLLMKRCKTLVERGDKVHLLIDSGTTLYPFFERIGETAVRYRANKEEWLDNLEITTNNLPGVQKLMETSREDPNNRFSPLAVRCHVFPGQALPIYSAVTGDETNKAVERLKQHARGQRVLFIALVVGNWIRLRLADGACPVPLARGTGHFEFKQRLVTNADEIYVVTPLGKVFLDFSADEINSALGFTSDQADPDRQPYREVEISHEKVRHVRMVSTSRSQERVLSALSTEVQAHLGTRHRDLRDFATAEPGKVPHVLFPLHNLPDDWEYQKETEFPHPYTRDEQFLKKYFFVPIDPRGLR